MQGAVLKVLNARKKIGCFVVAIVAGILLFGCAGTKEVKKDPFFEKWKVLSQESRDASPILKVRSIEIPPEPGMKKGDILPEEKTLPEDKVSLKMRDADVGAVLRALARSVRQNILIKSEIQGRVSVDFKEVPWDEAFISILRSQMLTYIWEGNILRIATVQDLENDLKLKDAQEKKREKAPLMTMVVPVDFADTKKLGENMAELLTKDEKGGTYGSVKVSEHTNSLIIQAARDDLKKIIAMIEKIDKPTPQIMIEGNIVETTKNTARDLGIQWGGMYAPRLGNHDLYVTPGGTSGTGAPLAGGYTPVAGSTGISGQGFGVNFPAAGMSATGAGSLGLMFGTIGGNILDMQLNALQSDGKLNILSSPSITTLDNQTAFTENGEKVPYVSVDKDGNREVKFEDVVLRLEITPHVIDGENMKMDINVKKDEVDNTRNVQGNPYIYKKQTDTTLIVKNGQTIVISGLTKQKIQDTTTGLPGLKSIPFLGWLFKSEGKSDAKEEVLIFITPHILGTGMEDKTKVSDTVDSEPVISGQ